MNGSGRQPGPATGFTLLELLLVLTIVGLALTVVPPLLSNAMPTLTLKGAVNDLALAMHRARGLAVTRNRTQEIRLLPEQGVYIAGEKPLRHSLPAAVKLGVEQGVLLDASTGEQAVRFFPDGSASGGLISLSDDRRRFELEVNWLTGRVQTREVDNAAG